MVTMATKLFTRVNSVILSEIELNAIKVISFELSSIKLGSSTSKMTYIGKVGKLVLSRTSCSLLPLSQYIAL
jgi:hypothetical protein